MATKLNSALLRDIAAADSGTFIRVSLFQLRLDPDQPRKLRFGPPVDNPEGIPQPPKVRLTDVADLLTQEKDDDDQIALVRLAVNILQDGVRTPITVTAERDGLYRVVTGERRVTAALLARDWAESIRSGKVADAYALRKDYDYDTIPAVVETIADTDRLRIQLAENLLRQDMSPEDMGRAWKKMLDDGLFPNVFSIAKHFGIEEMRIQSHIDLIDMHEEAAVLRAKGIRSIDVVGRLLSDIRVSKKRGEPPALFNAFMTLWEEKTTRDQDGNPVYPGAKSVLDAARKQIKNSGSETPVVVPVTPAAVSAAPAAVSAAPAAVSADPYEAGVNNLELEPPPDEEELAMDADDENDSLQSAAVGVSASSAECLPRRQQNTAIIITELKLTKDQAQRILKILGVEIDTDAITAEVVRDALYSV